MLEWKQTDICPAEIRNKEQRREERDFVESTVENTERILFPWFRKQFLGIELIFSRLCTFRAIFGIFMVKRRIFKKFVLKYIYRGAYMSVKINSIE